jgi:hypothetical protein
MFPLMLEQGCTAVFRIGTGLVNSYAQADIISR